MAFEEIYNALSTEEQQELSIIANPVRWAEVTLRNPRNPSEHFTWRRYQKSMVGFQPILKRTTEGEEYYENRMKIYRCGRRSGKTASMAAEIIWNAFTKSNFKIIVVTPYESQVREVFKMMISMIKGTFVIPSRIVKKPFLIEFSNGSTITGYTAGATSGSKGVGIRGTEADLIILDEIDHGIDDILDEVIFPIYNLNKKCVMIMSSTPSGRRGTFWEACNNQKDWGAKEFHVPSTMIPGWNEESERFARKTARTDSKYLHEYLAEFGELEEGVFQNRHLMKCMKEYDYDDLELNTKKFDYYMGVDWNELFGVTLNIIEKPRFGKNVKVWKKLTVQRTEYTQVEAVDVIIDWSKKIPFKAIYIDSGFGGAQGQWLKRYGANTPGSNLNDIVHPIDFGGKIEIRDQITGSRVKKQTKPFLVDNAVYFTEKRLLTIPKSEETENGLIGAMRGYKIKRFSVKSNEPIYECEVEDHELDALYLALLAITLETDPINERTPIQPIARIVKPLIPKDVGRNTEVTYVDSTTQKLHNILQQNSPNFQRSNSINKKKQRSRQIMQAPRRTNI